VRAVAALDMEVCCTLGMLNESQAQAAEGAGLTAYNHNLDTSPRFTAHHHHHVYEDRLQDHRSRAQGRSPFARRDSRFEIDETVVGLLHELSRLNPHPESVPINMLVRNENSARRVKELHRSIMVRPSRLRGFCCPPRAGGSPPAGANWAPEAGPRSASSAGANSIFTESSREPD